ncbi:uncharacterized protein LOC144668757 [Cetorhinus maximus]
MVSQHLVTKSSNAGTARAAMQLDDGAEPTQNQGKLLTAQRPEEEKAALGQQKLEEFAGISGGLRESPRATAITCGGTAARDQASRSDKPHPGLHRLEPHPMFIRTVGPSTRSEVPLQGPLELTEEQ